MKAGDENAYRIFYDAYFDRLWRYLIVVTRGDDDAAREALQATLLRVARHVKVFNDEKIFWGWLTVLARSACRDESRKRRRYFAFLDRFTRHSETGNDYHAEERLDALLVGQLAILPPEERRLIEQKYFERRSVREMSQTAQTTEKAMESKLSRIRLKLKNAVLAKLEH